MRLVQELPQKRGKLWEVEEISSEGMWGSRGGGIICCEGKGFDGYRWYRVKCDSGSEAVEM